MGIIHTGSLCGDTLENIIDKGVEDGHGLVGNTSVRVHLLEHCKSMRAEDRYMMNRVDQPL